MYVDINVDLMNKLGNTTFWLDVGTLCYKECGMRICDMSSVIGSSLATWNCCLDHRHT